MTTTIFIQDKHEQEQKLMIQLMDCLLDMTVATNTTVRPKPTIDATDLVNLADLDLDLDDNLPF
jgi:hypothetical protein